MNQSKNWLVWPKTSASPLHPTPIVKLTSSIKIATLFSELNHSYKFWQALGDSGISLASHKNSPLCSPLVLLLPCWSRFHSKHSMWLDVAYPTFSHLQQQRQQTKAPIMMTPATTDTVMIKIWKLTGNHKERGNAEIQLMLQRVISCGTETKYVASF